MVVLPCLCLSPGRADHTTSIHWGAQTSSFIQSADVYVEPMKLSTPPFTHSSGSYPPAECDTHQQGEQEGRVQVRKTEEEAPSPQQFKESRTWSLPSTTLGALPKAPERGCLSRRRWPGLLAIRGVSQIALFWVTTGTAAVAREHPGD